MHAFRSWASEARNAPVIIVGSFLILLILGSLFVFSAANGNPPRCKDYVVPRGATLSEIADHFRPDRLTRDEFIVLLMHENNLATDQVHADQTLKLPSGSRCPR